MTRLFRRFGSSDKGGATIEFIVAFPLVFGLVMASFELGMLLTRQVMLDRALDLTVRQVRLGQVAEVTHDKLKEMICERRPMIPDCESRIRLEMVPFNPRGNGGIAPGADCVDRGDPNKPLRRFRPGISNGLMVLRVCALVNPYFPPTQLAFLKVPLVDGSAYALVSSSAYVIEPL